MDINELKGQLKTLHEELARAIPSLEAMEGGCGVHEYHHAARRGDCADVSARVRQPAVVARARGEERAELVGKDGDKPLLEIIPDEKNLDPSMTLQKDNVHSNIDNWLGELESKQREVVVRRFGLHGHERSTLEEVGRELGVTRERVRQIQMEAPRRLRRILEGNGFSVDSIFYA